MTLLAGVSKLCYKLLLFLLSCEHYSDGPPPTDLTAEQVGLNVLFVMWTAPSPPPTDGYRVQITRGSTITTDNVIGTSHITSVNNQYGVYSIQVIALSTPP